MMDEKNISQKHLVCMFIFLLKLSKLIRYLYRLEESNLKFILCRYCIQTNVVKSLIV